MLSAIPIQPDAPTTLASSDRSTLSGTSNAHGVNRQLAARAACIGRRARQVKQHAYFAEVPPASANLLTTHRRRSIPSTASDTTDRRPSCSARTATSPAWRCTATRSAIGNILLVGLRPRRFAIGQFADHRSSLHLMKSRWSVRRDQWRAIASVPLRDSLLRLRSPLIHCLRD